MATKGNKVLVRVDTDDKGIKWNVFNAVAMAKNKETKKSEQVWAGEFRQPKTLEDAIGAYGDDKVYKVWSMEDYTNFPDSKRRAQGETKAAMTAQLLDALGKGDVGMVVELAKKLGYDLSKGIAAIKNAPNDDDDDDDETDE